MTSKVDIVNRALDKLGADTIVDLTQDSENARVMNRQYNIVLRSLLRSHTWNCAIARVILAPMATKPAFDFSYQFQLPSDCLRPLLESDTTDWTVEGKKILTNDGNTINLRYIRMLDDPNDMDDCFIEVFACKLAMESAEKITQSKTKRDSATQEYKDALVVARKANAFERIPDEQSASSWVDSRIVGAVLDPSNLSGLR